MKTRFRAMLVAGTVAAFAAAHAKEAEAEPLVSRLVRLRAGRVSDGERGAIQARRAYGGAS
jgi:hypothetical protein